MRKVSCLLSIIVVAFLSTPSFAGAPDEITYQGKLLENGEPAGAKSVTFELFEAASGGTRIWFQTQTVTPDDTGIYTVTLGSEANPIPADRAALWLQVKVGGSTLTPRSQLTSSTYALNVGTLPELDVSGNATIDGNVGIGTAPTANALEVLGDVRSSSAFYTYRKNMGSPTSWTNIFNHGEVETGTYLVNLVHQGQYGQEHILGLYFWRPNGPGEGFWYELSHNDGQGGSVYIQARVDGADGMLEMRCSASGAGTDVRVHFLKIGEWF